MFSYISTSLPYPFIYVRVCFLSMFEVVILLIIYSKHVFCFVNITVVYYNRVCVHSLLEYTPFWEGRIKEELKLLFSCQRFNGD